MPTDTSEKGLETLIMRHMTGVDGLAVTPNSVARPQAPYGGTGYIAGSAQDYDRAHALDVPQLFAFLRATQTEAFRKLALADANDTRDINRLKFLARLSAEIGKRGVIDVLRKGVAHGPLHVDLFYGTASTGNARAEARHAQNRFSITRQLAYSIDETRRALRPVPVHQRPADRHFRAEEQSHQTDGRGCRRAVPHRYTMKQAVEEGFILDVLKSLHAGGQLPRSGSGNRLKLDLDALLATAFILAPEARRAPAHQR